MRRLLPTSMAGWLILLIVLGLGVSQAVTIAIHYDSRREAQLLLENVRIAERVVAVTRAIGLLRLEERPAIAVGVSKSGLIVAWEPGNAVNKNKPRNDRAQLIAEVIDERHEGLELLRYRSGLLPGAVVIRGNRDRSTPCSANGSMTSMAACAMCWIRILARACMSSRCSWRIGPGSISPRPTWKRCRPGRRPRLR